MYEEEIKLEIVGKRLIVKHFVGNVIVDISNERDAYDWVQKEARRLANLRANLLREGEKFNQNE